MKCKLRFRRLDLAFLKQLFAKEERRKVTSESTVGNLNQHFKVPDKYIGWSVWVANFFDQYIEIRAGNKTIGTSQLRDSDCNTLSTFGCYVTGASAC